MWRNEVGCFEMLTAYFEEHQEQMRPGKSRRDFLLEILHTHEMSRLGFRDDDVILLPYNEQSQSFYVFDRSMSKTMQLQNLNEPPPLVRPRNYWACREPPRPFRPPCTALGGGLKAPGEGRLPVDVDEDLTVTAVCHGEVTALATPPPPPMLPPSVDNITALPTAFPPPEASGEASGPSAPAAPSDHLQIPTTSPSCESSAAPEVARRRRPGKRRLQRTIRSLRSIMPQCEALETGAADAAGPETPAAARPRRQLQAVNYSVVQKRRARQKAAGPAVEGKRRVGRPPGAVTKRGRRPKKHKKRKGRPPGPRPQPPQSPLPPPPLSFVVLPKDEVVDVELQQEKAAFQLVENSGLELTPGSVRKSPRLVGHQNPILERLKRREYRRRRGEDTDLSEFSDEGIAPTPSPPIHSCPVCTRQFKYKASFDHHMRKHTEKKFQCSVCLKRFTTKAYCKSHERRHSEGPPALRCRFCGAQFVGKADRQEHEMRAHIAAV